MNKKFIACSIIVFLLCLCNAILPYKIYADWGLCGTFGDQFGAVNALFSGLAFLGLIYTIKQQSEDLRLQKEELSTMNDEAKKQRFESTFFSMMQLQQQIVADLNAREYIPHTKFYSTQNIETTNEIHDFIGRNMFYYSFCVCEHVPSDLNLVGFSHRGMREVIYYYGIEKIKVFETQDFFSHYYQHMMEIIHFVENEVEKNNEYNYINILRSTLSRYELVWLYYKGLVEGGELKRLIEKYSLLKNLNITNLTLSRNAVNIVKNKLMQIGEGGYEDDIDSISYTLEQNGLTGTDFEFFLSTAQYSENKYTLSAFYDNPDIMQRGRTHFEKLNLFLK